MIQGLAGSLMTSRPDPVSSTLIRNWSIAILDDSRFWPEADISTAPALGPVLFSAFDPKRAFAPCLLRSSSLPLGPVYVGLLIGIRHPKIAPYQGRSPPYGALCVSRIIGPKGPSTRWLGRCAK
jgi:hypothetical protein